MSDRQEGAVYRDEDTNSIVMEIAGKKTAIPAEHAEEVHHLLAEWLEGNDD